MAINNTVWDQKKIPALEFCTLSRAADLLDCETNDLIHLADIGAIEICLRLRNFKAVLYSPSLWEEGNGWEEEFKPKLIGSYTNRSKLSLFMPVAKLDTTPESTEKIKRCYHNEDMPSMKRPLLILSGLWSISANTLPSSFFNDLSKGGEAALTPFDILFKEADIPLNAKDCGEYSGDNYIIMANPITEHLYSSGFLDKTNITNIATVTASDIFITRQQIEKVSEYSGREIPNYINGGVNRLQEVEIDIERPARTTAKQAALIVALLKAIGLTDSDLTGSAAQIMSKANNGRDLPFPDDEKTLIEWLRRGGIRR